jgi:hypothetical protein
LRLVHKLVKETGNLEEPEERDEKDYECKEREEHLEGYSCRIGHHVVFNESLDRVDQVLMQLTKPYPTLSRSRHMHLLYPSLCPRRELKSESVVLEESGNNIAGDIGMSGVLFGSTFLATATTLPELSTGLASVKLGDYKLAVSDIFGGNAFLPVLLLLAGLLSGMAPLAQAQKTDIFLTGLAALLTAVYVYGLIFRPRLRFLQMGIDSLVLLILYVVGILGLIDVAHG